jgi:hypothetical protein
VTYIRNYPATYHREPAVIHEYTRRDKYGRTVLHLEVAVPNVPRRATVLLVTLPKGYAAEYGHRYMVTDWQTHTTDYYVTRAEAKAAQRAQAEAHHAALLAA